MRRLIPAMPLLLIAALPLSAQQPGPVVFSEIMWMGSTASNADEWIELYNRSDEKVELTNWTITRLTGDGEQPMLTIEGGILSPGGTFLIANYDADHASSRLAVAPQLVSSQIALPNTKLQLRLYDNLPDQGGNLIDVADDGKGAPLAGDGALKQAMVRVRFDGDGASPDSWATAQEASGWDAGAEELGTPGAIPGLLNSESSSSQDGTPVSPVSWAALKDRSNQVE